LHSEPLDRSAAAASTAQLLADLPQVRYAHLATHGFLADPKFRSALQVDEKQFAQLGRERSVAGARSPLVLSGLVLAGANKADTPDRGILTAEAIVGLRLDDLELAVLSACETGLGQVAGGEGVFGLQRAFHIAGTRNAVASLWKVDDDATAALMSAPTPENGRRLCCPGMEDDSCERWVIFLAFEQSRPPVNTCRCLGRSKTVTLGPPSENRKGFPPQALAQAV